MRVFKSTASFKKDVKRPLVLALGNFDGVHRGHCKLLDYVVEQAKKENGRPAILTFPDHPQKVLHPGHAPEYLQSIEQRLAFFKARGIKICFLQKFNKRFAALTAENFVKKILVKNLYVREICIGYNARFGRGREGDADFLRTMGKKCGFKVFQALPVSVGGTPVSSTAIRNAVRRGKMDRAATLLGRSWSLTGKIGKGSGRGRKIGFPTANVDLNEYVRPATGVYAVRVFVKNKTRAGVANFGTRPTFGLRDQPVLEVHIPGFRGNLYGQKAEVFFIKRLRGEKKFPSVERLKRQISTDIANAKKLLRK